MDFSALKKILSEKEYESLAAPSKGTCPQRAYYIPEGAKTSLCGEWSFKYFEDMRDLEDGDWDKIFVPSCWQIKGYDHHMYANARYPFPFDPPHVPENMPCALYRRNFIFEGGGRCYLRFEGVDSFYYLFINNHYVGYSSVSHSGEEYDITDYIHIGENTVEVLNLKWCAGSYLEDQDKLRMSGIFREVYLLVRPENCLWDFFVRPSFCGETFLEIEFTGAEKEQKEVVLSLKGKTIAQATTTSQDLLINIADPVLWNSENPVLYDLEIKSQGEIIKIKYALRKVAIEEGIFKINGKAVKLLGVNRHEIDLENGYAITQERMIEDLKLIKQANINAIRTSHYPNHPYFLQLCDEAGIYVIDEADIECHGVLYQNGKDNFDLYDTFADDVRFKNAILDRVNRLVERDKNFGCVVMWSLGNESGWGDCFRNAAKQVSIRDSSRILHYEDINVAPKKREGETFPELPIISRMYYNVDWIENTYLQRKNETSPYIDYDSEQYLRPIFLCEYSHAMGTGPGDLGTYVDCFYKHDKVIGGCVWEFSDQAAYGDYGKHKHVPLYGGDFGNEADRLITETCGNFCMDGLVNEHRVPHRGYFEYQNVLRPIRISYENNVFYAQNMLFFTNAEKKFKLFAKVMSGEKVIAKKQISLKDLKPGCKMPLHLDLSSFGQKSLYVQFEIKTKTETLFVPKGFCVGKDGVVLRENNERFFAEKQKIFNGNSILSESGIVQPASCKYISINAEDFSVVYDTRKGAIVSVCSGDEEILDAPISFNLTRAETDNDMYNKIFWQDYGLYNCYSTGKEICMLENGFKQKISIQSMWRKNIAEIEVEYRFIKNKIYMHMRAEIGNHIRFLPRFGITVPLKKSFCKVKWDGYGPYSSYADMDKAAIRGVYNLDTKVEKDTHLKPQEFGSRSKTRSLYIAGKKNVLYVEAQTPFSFSAANFSQDELRKRKYSFELKKSNYTEFCLDVAMSGVGSGACGEELPPIFRVGQKNLETEWIFCFERLHGGAIKPKW